MKGMVFVELLQMAESALGEERVDAVLDRCELSSGGAYNAVGSYPCSELVALVGAFSDETGLPGDALQRQFGHWMLERFKRSYPHFFEGRENALELLEAVDAEVHVEVRKLYPDAELPRFETERLAPDTLRLVYASPRPLAAFCHGLIEACVEHYGHDAEIAREDVPAGSQGTAAFKVRLAA